MPEKKRTIRLKTMKDEKEVEVSTEDIEKVTPFMPYSYPHPDHANKGAKVQLKKEFIITTSTVEEVEQMVKEAGGRIRGKNSE